MQQTVFIISDLHLGGRPPEGDDPGFQICGERSQTLLADFLGWVASLRSEGQHVHLVVNGDAVDFLAEEPFQAFTADEAEAERKLGTIFERTGAVWKAFGDVVRSDAEVTFLLGNHDVELALPRPRTLLRKTLGSGRVDLLFDNSALRVGSKVLIEHGNRYDGWNAIRHNTLRQIRSSVSRDEKPPAFPDPAGSRLVVEVMNRLKRELRFIDLLKPETEAALPLIAALRPLEYKTLKQLRKYKREAEKVAYREDGVPKHTELIAGKDDEIGEKMRDFAEAGGIDTEQISYGGTAMGLLERWAVKRLKGDSRDAELKIAYEALEIFFAANFTAFDTQMELPEYMRPLNAAVNRGFRTISYGHTHLAKRMAITAGGTYLNTGTWAELMAVPRGILLNKKEEGMQELRAFLDDLAENKLDKWRKPLPTFAKLVLDGDEVIEQDVYLYLGNRGECS